MPMPLEGIRVIDWTIWQQGPVASVMLGDLGAEVIKIEQRESGDPGRGILKMSGIDLSDRPNFYFEANNRNKLGMAIDLKKPEGREIVYRLVEKADVFVQNFRLGVAERLGLGYEDLAQRNPRLIYASATGYGPKGPEAEDPSFDQMGLARSGFMYAVGEPDMPPLQVAGGIADQMGAIMLAYGVLAALVARERFGVGQKVDASHLGSMIWLQGLSVSSRAMMGFAIPRLPRKYAANPLWNHYRCQDGLWICLGMLQPDRYWADFVRALGHPELATDPRFADLRVRAAHAAEAVEILDQIFATRPRAEWLEILRNGGDFIFTVVNSVDDLPDDPQVVANDYITPFEHPRFGATKVVGIPVQLSATPGAIRLPAPEFGQHTEQILTSLLGYSWEEVAALKEREVI
ncbi:MAG: CoA transferase [Candidatus Binatia bacterium]|nr:MAG: CoA transferase [Candidatus Binatia bacterium]